MATPVDPDLRGWYTQQESPFLDGNSPFADKDADQFIALSQASDTSTAQAVI